MQIDGSCHCGSITYEADIDPAKVAICHCTDCQSLSGTAFVAYVPVAKADFRLRGAPTVYVKTAQSGNRRAQAFCQTCGSRLYASAVEDPQVFNLRLGTIRQRAELRPRQQVWCRSALGWVMDLDSVRKIATQP
jgi:hypothetical protein